MSRKKQEKVQFNYYDIPRDSYVLFRLGRKELHNSEEGAQKFHSHNYLEVSCCTEGEGTIISENGERPYFSDTFCIVPGNYAYKINCVKDSVWDVFYVDAERFLNDMYPGRSRLVEEILRRINSGGRSFRMEGCPVLGNLVQSLLREGYRGGEFTKECIKGYLLAFLMETARMNFGDKTSDWWSWEYSQEEGEICQISNALCYVKDHYNEPIRIKDLASVCGLSETHFRRLFLEYTHSSPADYVGRVRIRAACSLMLNTSSTLDEIAMKTGFVSMTTFNRNFRKFTGTSPHNWKKEKHNRRKNMDIYYN